MSSVSGSERNRHTEELRNSREEYESRETEQAKRHRREMRKLNEQHVQEIQELKDRFDQQLSQLRKKSSESLSERDQENQAKIQQLRDMYTEQIKKRSIDNEARRQAAEAAFASTLEKERAITEEQKASLKNTFDAEIKNRESIYQNTEKANKEKLQQSIADRTTKLNEKHAKEMKATTEDRDRRVSQMQRDIESTQSTLKNELKDQQRVSRNRLDQVENNWMTVTREKSKEYDTILQSRDQLLQASREKSKKKYDEALRAKLAQLDEAHQSLKDQASERIDREVRVAENDKRRIQNDRILENITNRRLRDLEMSNLQDQYEDRFKSLYTEKEQVQQIANDRSREKIVQVQDRMDKLMQNVNRDNKLKIALSETQHKEDRAQQQSLHGAQMEQLRNSTDNRVNKIMQLTAKTTRDQQQFHDKNLEQMRGIYQENLVGQREKQIEDLKTQYLRMDARMKEASKAQKEKIDVLTSGFQERLEGTINRYESELEKQDKSYQLKMTQREKAHKMELESQGMKFGTKMAQMQEAHDKDIERLEKRHLEQMASLANRIDYYKKKA